MLRQRGQSVVEYGLLMASVGVALLLGANAFGAVLHAWYATLFTRITSTG